MKSFSTSTSNIFLILVLVFILILSAACSTNEEPNIPLFKLDKGEVIQI